jgi:hypothetical protein
MEYEINMTPDEIYDSLSLSERREMYELLIYEFDIDDYDGDTEPIIEKAKNLSTEEKEDILEIIAHHFYGNETVLDKNFNSFIIKLLGKRNLLSEEDEKRIIDIVNKL